MAVFSKEQEGFYWSVNSEVWEVLVSSVFTGRTEGRIWRHFHSFGEVRFQCSLRYAVLPWGGPSFRHHAPVLYEASRSPPSGKNEAPPL